MKKHKTYNLGSSLVECLVTILTLAISMTGMISYRYYCVKQAENAKSLSQAAYSVQAIAETWASQKGSDTFDLSDYSFDSFQVTPMTSLDCDLPSDFIEASHYCIDIEDHLFYATLAYQDSENVSDTRCLYIALTWTDHCGDTQEHVISTITQSTASTTSESVTSSELAQDAADAIQDSATSVAEGIAAAAQDTAAATADDARTR